MATNQPDPNQQAQLQQMVRLLQSYQETIETLEQQRQLVEASIQEREQAIDALQELEGRDEPGQLIVPVGGSQFLYASVEETDKVLSSVGSDVVVEEPVAKAIERSRERIDELEEAVDQIGERVDEITEEAEQLQAQVQQLYQG